MFDCSLRSRGSRFEAAAFLSHSQTKSVSARSFVQDSGARSWARLRSAYFVVLLRRRSQRKERLSSLRLALLAPLAEAGALVGAAFLTHSQTKDMSARSLVQDSGAPTWLRTAARDSRRSQLGC